MEVVKIIYIFLIPILSIIGFIFNILSSIVFGLIIKNGQRDDMYKNLLLKSLCQIMGCFFSVFNLLYFYDGKLKYTYIVSVWFIWFRYYIIPALLMASNGFEIVATFNCARSIEKRMKWCEKKVTFWFWVAFILILSFGVEIFPIFAFSIVEYDIKNNSFNETLHIYSVSFKHQSEFYTLGLYESIIKHVIFFLILLSLNIYIVFKLIQIGRRKKRLTSNNNSNNRNSNRAENRRMIMILVLFLAFILGHFPYFLWFIIQRSGLMNNLNLKFWYDVGFCGEAVSYLSYSISFFVYLAFNNIFRSFSMKIIPFRLIN
jgi:hypothetical protein